MELNELLRDIRMKIARGDFAAARGLLLGSAEHGENAELQALGARILGFTDGFVKAHGMFLDLEAVWPDNFEVFRMHCQLLQEQGDYNEGLAVARRLLARFATRFETYEILSDMLELSGRTSEALQVAGEGLAGFPGHSELLERQKRLSLKFNQADMNTAGLEEIRSELTCGPLLPDEENIRLLLQTFRSRSGVHAVQTKMGKSWGYIPEKRDMTEEDIRKHLGGEKTLGLYVTDLNNTSRLMVMDLDVRKAWLNAYGNSPEERRRINGLIRESANQLVENCRMAGLSPLVESSGNKGLHFWFFGAEDFACRYWRMLGAWLVGKFRSIPEELSWEIFPKQDRVPEDGLGNLVKMPLGTHQKTGRRSFFVDSETLQPHSDQMKVLREAERIDRQDLEQILGTIAVDSCGNGHAGLRASTDGKVDNRAAIARVLTGKSGGQCDPATEQNLQIAVRIPLPERQTLEVEKLLAGCRPLWEIMEKARHTHCLTTDEKHAFVYTFAHLGEEGRVFIHQVLNQIEEYQPDAVNALIRAVPPNAPGCGKIRKRVPELCSMALCNCQFRLPEGSYASPLIHAGIFPGAGKGGLACRKNMQPANISGREMIGGESANIDRLMQEFLEVTEELARLRERAALLRRQINQIFNDAGQDRIETRIRVYQRLPDEIESMVALAKQQA